MKKQVSQKTSALTPRDIEGLLSDQTAVILGAVDSRIEKSEERFSRKLDELKQSLSDGLA